MMSASFITCITVSQKLITEKHTSKCLASLERRTDQYKAAKCSFHFRTPVTLTALFTVALGRCLTAFAFIPDQTEQKQKIHVKIKCYEGICFMCSVRITLNNMNAILDDMVN